MLIKIKCPVCRAANDLSDAKQPCRRCGEDLSLLYQTKGHALKYRLYLAQQLHNTPITQQQRLAQVAEWLCRK